MTALPLQKEVIIASKWIAAAAAHPDVVGC